MFRWVLIVVSALMLVCVSLQPAAAFDLHGDTPTSSSSALPDDDGAGPAAPDLAIEMPELFTGRTPWAIARDAASAPRSHATRLTPPPYLAPLLRPPRQFA